MARYFDALRKELGSDEIPVTFVFNDSNTVPISYFGDNVSLRLDIANLFDTDPPLFASNAPQANTDTLLYDVFGRSYTLRLALSY